MIMDIANKLIRIGNYFHIGMKLYTATYNGKVLTYTLNEIKIEILTNEIAHITFVCESEYTGLDEYFQYEDLEKNILFRDFNKAQEQAAFNLIKYYGEGN